MSNQDPRQAVYLIIRDELADLHGMWEGAVAEEHNVFLLAVSPQLASASKLSRQLTSRMGRKLARIARRVSEFTFGLEKVPKHVHNAELTRHEKLVVPHESDDTFVYSKFDKDSVKELALGLVTEAESSKVGTDEFRKAYESALDQLESGPRASEVWHFQVDLAVLDPSVGFAELESGGNLDTSNAIGQTRKLIQAGLAYGDPEVALHFCTAYANNGEGKPISGALRKYFLEDPPHIDGLLAGERWWSRILPEPLSFGDFLAEFERVATDYEIAGPQE